MSEDDSQKTFTVRIMQGRPGSGIRSRVFGEPQS
jgi:hypothetical protein